MSSNDRNKVLQTIPNEGQYFLGEDFVLFCKLRGLEHLSHRSLVLGPPRGTLSLVPLSRHNISQGKPPNLLMFLMVDEFCKVMNMAVAKPVRNSHWIGLSNGARYEAKPIVDTLADRWGGGSAAFLVSFHSANATKFREAN